MIEDPRMPMIKALAAAANGLIDQSMMLPGRIVEVEINDQFGCIEITASALVADDFGAKYIDIWTVVPLAFASPATVFHAVMSAWLVHQMAEAGHGGDEELGPDGNRLN